MHELADESLRDILPIAKKIVNALGASNYNILQVWEMLAYLGTFYAKFGFDRTTGDWRIKKVMNPTTIVS